MEKRDVMSEALIFAAKAHSGQKRKYTGEPYIYHPIAVSGLVKRAGASFNAIVAALLHDTVEDTDVSQKEINDTFGLSIGHLVFWLTDVSKKTDGNRKTRKAIDREHIGKSILEAKTIKLADLIDNASDIARNDVNFAKIYMAEKRLLLEVLRDGEQSLFLRASKIVEDYYEKG